MPVLALLLSLFGRWPLLLATLRSRRHLLLLSLTTVLVSGNWLLFIWAMQNDFILEASLGYFINPLLNIALGMIFLGERLRRWQLVAVAIAAWGVAYQTWQLGVLPWVSGAMVRLITGFGGFLGHKRDGDPGPKAIWEGMQRVSAFAVGIEAGLAAYAPDG